MNNLKKMLNFLIYIINTSTLMIFRANKGIRGRIPDFTQNDQVVISSYKMSYKTEVWSFNINTLS